MEGFFSCFDKEETELSTFGGFAAQTQALLMLPLTALLSI